MWSRRTASVLLLAAALALAAVVTLADTVTTRDGKTYVGVADVIGDKVRVTREDGSVITLKKDEVKEIVRSKTRLQEYANREAKVKTDDAEGRFQLALWCERNRLRTEAIRQCAKALAVQPGHRGAREMMLLLLRADAGPATSTGDNGGRTTTRAVDATKTRNLLLEETPKTQRFFRVFVQPILHRECASALCHGGPESGRLRLKRSRMGGLATSDVLLPNFDAIYPYITDFYNPEKCLLLQHPLAIKAGGVPSKCKKVFVTKADRRIQVMGRLVKMLLLPAPPKADEGGRTRE